MILADTSVWVDHLRAGLPTFAAALNSGQVLGHPFVTGELACGNLRHRRRVLELLNELSQAAVATNDEVLACIERRRLHGRGLGWIDVHLIASALVTPCQLWTSDRPLAGAAGRCGVQLATASSPRSG